jgi:hypothetical protein
LLKYNRNHIPYISHLQERASKLLDLVLSFESVPMKLKLPIFPNMNGVEISAWRDGRDPAGEEALVLGEAVPANDFPTAFPVVSSATLKGFFTEELFHTLFPPDFSAPKVTEATFPLDMAAIGISRLLRGFLNLKILTLKFSSVNSCDKLPSVLLQLRGLEELTLHFVKVFVGQKCCPGCTRYSF